MINILTPTEDLMRELFDIQKSFNELGVSKKHKETISNIGLKAFENIMSLPKEDNSLYNKYDSLQGSN